MKKIVVLLSIILVIISVLYWFYPSPTSPFDTYKNLIPHTYRIGFTNLNEERALETIPVTGKIPTWLSGTLFRNGPAQFTTSSSWVSNWFDGLAMIHAFSVHDGNVSYANKFLHSDDYEYVQKTGTMDYPGFAQDPCKTIFKRLFSLFISTIGQHKDHMPNANVNIAQYTDRLIALTETPLPIEFDPETLTTLGALHYNDPFPESNIHDTAHPHYDTVRQEHLGYFTQFGRHSTHNVFRIKDGSTQREIIASIPVEHPSYMHSFFITEHYAILTLLPLVANPLSLLLKKQAFIKNFTWQPELGTQLAVVDRVHNKLVGLYKTIPFFAFHTVNAFESDNRIVMDIVMYPDASSINDAQFTDLLSDVPRGLHHDAAAPDADIFDTGRLTRMTLNLATHAVELKTLCNTFIELPRINYEHYNTKPYTYVYAYSNKHSPFYVADTLYKVNVHNGSTSEWYEEFCYPGEPVFVAAPSAKLEDDGVVLSVVLDVRKETSFLLILDGQTFKEIARAQVPHHIPFGIHGVFITQDS